MGASGAVHCHSRSQTDSDFGERAFNPIQERVTDSTRRQADVQMTNRQEKAKKLEEASRMIQKCFAACLNDRCVRPFQLSNAQAEMEISCARRSGDAGSSRKMGVYYMATLLFKIYFKVSRRR